MLLGYSFLGLFSKDQLLHETFFLSVLVVFLGCHLSGPFRIHRRQNENPEDSLQCNSLKPKVPKQINLYLFRSPVLAFIICSGSLLGRRNTSVQFSSVTQSSLTSLRPHESQNTRLPCPSPIPRVYSNSCPSSW